MAKAKTINLLLNEGTLNGVINIEASSWNKGELYSAPRESVNDLIASDACAKYGVYLLLSEDKVYVGQASDLSRRIKQHIIGKSWWERAVILTTLDDSLTRSDIDYIEAFLIEKAEGIGKLDCDNRKAGNKQKLSKFREVEILQYLEEAVFLLELIGVDVFCDKKKIAKKEKHSRLINSVKNLTDAEKVIREKKEALSFLKEKQLEILDNANYSKRQDNKPEFWLNPSVKALNKDWDIILNDQYKNEIVIIRIPKCTFTIKTDKKDGLLTRHDNPNRLDLSIQADTFEDRRSKFDFSIYIKERIKY
ncbi:MAG: GIY-YIG nuclease family protein [Oscillospiraceae bacterium]|nr:GIY-YIG nuclease family protein [Oscillospiraceae bacterium]